MQYAAADDAIGRKDEQAALKMLRELARERFALAHWRLGKMEDARSNFAAAYTSYKRFLLVGCAAGSAETVESRLRVLENRAPWLAEYAAAGKAYEKGDFAGALVSLNSVMDAKPGFPLAHRLLAMSAMKLDRMDVARRAVETYADADPYAAGKKSDPYICEMSR